MNKLTKSERMQLKEHEAVIDNGIHTFVDVGNALLSIREGRLYKSEYDTFAAYCATKWGFNRNYANKIINASEVVRNLSTMEPKPESGDLSYNVDDLCTTVLKIPTTERVVRPLTKLTPEQQPVAWKAALSKAQSEGRAVIARDVEQAVEAIKPALQPKPAKTHYLEDMKKAWGLSTLEEKREFILWVNHGLCENSCKANGTIICRHRHVID